MNGYTYYKGPPKEFYPPVMMDYRYMNGRTPKMNDTNKEWKRHRSETSEHEETTSIDTTGHKKSFSRLLTRFADKTSMVGVLYISSAKLVWAKIIWSILLLGAVAMVALHLWYLCDQFFAFPKVTKLSLGFNNLRLPKVTLCNTNKLHKGRLNAYAGASSLKDMIEDLDPLNLVPDQFGPNFDISKYLPTLPPKDPKEQLPTVPTLDPTQPLPTIPTLNITDPLPTLPPFEPTDSIPTAPPLPKDTDKGGFGGFGKRRKRFVGLSNLPDLSKYDPDFFDQDDDRDFKWDEFSAPIDEATKLENTFKSLFMDISGKDRGKLGHNISDMLLSCTFNGRTCTSQLFELTQTAEYGNCWSIDRKNLQVTKSGPSGGLSLTLHLEVAEYLEGIANGYGLRVVIQQPDTIPFPADEGHYISASFETSIGLKQISIEREQAPYGDCDPNIAGQFESKYNYSYTARACYTTCEIDVLLDTCGCFDDDTAFLAIRRNQSLRPCRTVAEKKCKFKMDIKIERKEIPCHCPVPCSEIAYERYISSRQWPSESYAMVLLEGICRKDSTVCKTIRDEFKDGKGLSHNFLKLNIYFEDLNFENITEQPEIENAQFLSDVGGAFGLWIGLSILSICEIFQLIAELCAFAYHKTVRENAQKRKQKRHERARRHFYSDIRHNRYKERAPDSEQKWPHTNYYNHIYNISSLGDERPKLRPDLWFDRHYQSLYRNNSTHTHSNNV